MTPDYCTQCNRTGLKPKRENGVVSLEDCECVAKLKRQFLITQANVQPRYVDFTLDKLSPEFKKRNKKQLQVVEDYLANLDENIKNGKGLFFQSDPGLAKSSIISYIIVCAIEKGYNSYFSRFSSLITMKFDALDDMDVRRKLNRIIYETELLAIEEVEQVYTRNESLADNLISELIGEIYDLKKAIILSGNTSKRALREANKFTAGVVDRFSELKDVIFVGESFRCVSE